MNDPQPGILIAPDELESLLQWQHCLPVAVVPAHVYAAQHIPGSVLLEPAALVSGEHPAVGKLPQPAALQRLCDTLGLREDSRVVAYDDEGGGWAGRLLWTLDVIGHHRYSLLDGGLIAWRECGYPLTNLPTHRSAESYSMKPDRAALASKEDVLAALDDPGVVIWDARSPEEFAGTRVTALRNGHIPGAVNLDWFELMDRSNGLRLLPESVLREKLSQHGIDGQKRVITHCLTHHRSGLTYLAGKALGFDIRAYDGSWSEWGNDPDTPIVTGP